MVRALPPEGIALLNGDDPHVRWMAGQAAARVITFGERRQPPSRVGRFVGEQGSLTSPFNWKARHRRAKLREHMIYVLAAIAAARKRSTFARPPSGRAAADDHAWN
jgi:UDP-N-acetylmuramoyl-tripeptide--D-alanyl-D-alanine ligase